MRKLKVPGTDTYGCTPQRWRNSSTILAECYHGIRRTSAVAGPGQRRQAERLLIDAGNSGAPGGGLLWHDASTHAEQRLFSYSARLLLDVVAFNGIENAPPP